MCDLNTTEFMRAIALNLGIWSFSIGLAFYVWHIAEDVMKTKPKS